MTIHRLPLLIRGALAAFAALLVSNVSWATEAAQAARVTISVGGESGDPASRHFLDQAQRYADGNFRKVYFYPADLDGHVERRYRPGQQP